MSMETKLEEAIEHFAFDGTLMDKVSYGSGHINDTYKLVFQTVEGTVRQYILQKMNGSIFQKPKELMENIANVTTHLRRKIIENGGDPERETLNIILTKDGQSMYQDTEGGNWRAYGFIEDAICYDLVENPDDFYQSAVAFGNFQSLLSDFPAEKLHETIVDFHNTVARFNRFKEVVKADPLGRAKDVEKEIRFVMEREQECHVICEMLEKGELPLRVTHNDTKLNNIMIDKATGKAICVIDLDTVMPGTALNDFGDSIRFGASTALEDEQDLDKVSCDMELFEVYTRGFIEGCKGALTENEIKMLPMGAKLMTLECGIRFLTDHLEGDVYFKIHRDGHNLDRARTQFKLVYDMEQKWSTMTAIVGKYKK